MKFLWKLFSRLLASLLSILLFLSLVLIPLISFVTDTAKPEKIVDLIFSSSILRQFPCPDPHRVLLSNGTVDTDVDTEQALTNMLRDLLCSGEITVGEIIDTLKDKLNRGELDVAGLTRALQSLIDSGEVNAEALLEKFGVPLSLYQAFLSAEGSLDIDALVETFTVLISSDLLDMDVLLEEAGLSADTEINTERIMKKLAKSSAAKALISTYAEDVLNAATGIEEAPTLTADTVLDILQPHLEELVTIVADSLPDNTAVDRHKLEKAIHKAASAALPPLIDTLPPARELADKVIDRNDPTLSAAMDILRFIRSGHLKTAAICIAVLLALLIFLLRLPSFSGLRWVGSEAISSALLLGALSFFLQTQYLRDILSSAAAGAEGLIFPLLFELSATFLPFAVIYGVSGLVLVVSSKILNAVFEDRD
ncbi:MAG: hypothetical protein E7435_02255 [Ruminococcaceae bacterium]|nr:hypothetical protein [Oscillospiraceae bacterium]